MFTPRRWVVVTAKYAASLLAGIVFALIGQGLTLAIALGILSGRGIHRSLSSGSVVQLGLGTLAAAALWGGIGVGVGAVVRNPDIGAVIGVLVWVFVVENLLFGFVPSVGRFTPGRAQDALTGMSADHLLPAAAGGIVLLAWSLGLLAAGLIATRARDVDESSHMARPRAPRPRTDRDARLGQCSGMTPEGPVTNTPSASYWEEDAMSKAASDDCASWSSCGRGCCRAHSRAARSGVGDPGAREANCARCARRRRACALPPGIAIPPLAMWRGQARACAAIAAQPSLVTNPKPFYDEGNNTAYFTITGSLNGKPVHFSGESDWTPQMALIDKLGLAAPNGQPLRLEPSRHGTVGGNKKQTFAPGVLRPGDLVTCRVHRSYQGIPLAMSVPIHRGFGSMSGAGPQGVMAVRVRANGAVIASCVARDRLPLLTTNE